MTPTEDAGNAVEPAFVERLARAGVIPVLRTATADGAVEAVRTCAAGGLDVVELTATTPGWASALERVRAELPDLLVGLGTVRTAAQALQAREAGAQFLVSPCPAPEAREVVDGDLPLIEGGLTVGEVLGAADRGVAKLFPAHVGGPTYLRSLLAVSPGARIIPTGGIALADVPAWLAAGALAVGVGRDLLESDDIAGAVRRALASRG